MDFNDMMNNRKKLQGLFIIALLLTGLFACKKADHFYQELTALPQIDYGTNDAYKGSYTVGDTMRIAGKLQPQSNLQITIGGVAANIIKIDSVAYVIGSPGIGIRINRVAFLITAGMVGKAREVKVTSGGYSTIGSPVDIYPAVEPGSVSKTLQNVLVKSFTNANNVFLYGLTGKGDVYYYAADTKDLRRIKKDGTEEILCDLTKSIDPSANVLVNTFLAGGVDPQGRYVYFSAITSQGYRFCKLDISGKHISTLNQSADVSAPYEGQVGQVHMIVTGIYPAANDNLYLAVGLGNGNLQKNDGSVFVPDAIAHYSAANGHITYCYKGLGQINSSNRYPGMPGTGVSGSVLTGNSVVGLRLSPGEDLLYVLEQNFSIGRAIDVFDLDTRTKLYGFSTNNATNSLTELDVTASFPNLHINMGVAAMPDNSFGYLPMPGKRLQVLLYQYVDASVIGKPGNIAPQYGFPRWITFDFGQQRSYAYAPGRLVQNNYTFQPTVYLAPHVAKEDLLLNYDEDGNLYATANGKAALIKTQPVN